MLVRREAARGGRLPRPGLLRLLRRDRLLQAPARRRLGGPARARRPSAVHHEQLATDLARERRRIVEFHRGRDRYMRKHHGPVTAALARPLAAWPYLVRALAAIVLGATIRGATSRTRSPRCGRGAARGFARRPRRATLRPGRASQRPRARRIASCSRRYREPSTSKSGSRSSSQRGSHQVVSPASPHDRRQEDEADDRRVDQHRGREADAELLDDHEVREGERGEDPDHDHRRAGDDARRAARSPNAIASSSACLRTNSSRIRVSRNTW